MAFGIPWKDIESFLDGAIGQTVESILSGQAEQEAQLRARVDAGVTQGLDALAREVVAEASKRTAFIGGGAALPDLFPFGGWPTLIAAIGADFTLTLREELSMLCKLGYLYEPERNRELRQREAIAIMAAVKGKDKGGELAGTAEVGKLVAMMGAKHAAERLLMHVGRKFFQKKLLAFIPGLGILLSGGVNYFSTRSLGDYAIAYYSKRRKQGPGPTAADLEFLRLKTSQLRILVNMARADGGISPAEEELYRDSLMVFGLTAAEQTGALADLHSEAPGEPLETDEIRKLTMDDRSFLYRQAVAMAWIDGEPAEGKRAYLELLRKLLGIDAKEAAKVTEEVREDLRGSGRGG
jgi:tellurite resistance protein